VVAITSFPSKSDPYIFLFFCFFETGERLLTRVIITRSRAYVQIRNFGRLFRPRTGTKIPFALSTTSRVLFYRRLPAKPSQAPPCLVAIDIPYYVKYVVNDTAFRSYPWCGDRGGRVTHIVTRNPFFVSSQIKVITRISFNDECTRVLRER